MYINICNKTFETNEIINLIIRNNKVLIDTEEDFYELRYSNKEDIREAEEYLKFKSITRNELLNAVNTIIVVCEYFINSKDQCEDCPLQRKEGCIFTTIPIEWRR